MWIPVDLSNPDAPCCHVIGYHSLSLNVEASQKDNIKDTIVNRVNRNSI